MQFVDLKLAQRLEEVNALEGVAYARAHAKISPDTGATSIRIMGGHAVFAGANSPVTQAFGLGLNGSVIEAELDELEEFFRSRGAATNIELCPHADPGFLEMLMQRGYRTGIFESVIVLSFNS